MIAIDGDRIHEDQQPSSNVTCRRCTRCEPPRGRRPEAHRQEDCGRHRQRRDDDDVVEREGRLAQQSAQVEPRVVVVLRVKRHVPGRAVDRVQPQVRPVRVEDDGAGDRHRDQRSQRLERLLMHLVQAREQHATGHRCSDEQEQLRAQEDEAREKFRRPHGEHEQGVGRRHRDVDAVDPHEQRARFRRRPPTPSTHATG